MVFLKQADLVIVTTESDLPTWLVIAPATRIHLIPTRTHPSCRASATRLPRTHQSALRKLIPLGDRILVKRINALTQTAGGVFLPESNVKKPNEGEVVAVGPGHKMEDGSRLTVDVSIGDKVLLPEFGGNVVTVADEEMFLFRNNDILGILEE